MGFESFSKKGEPEAESEKDKEKIDEDTKKRAEMSGLSEEEYKLLKGLGEELADAHMGRKTRPVEEILRDTGQSFIDLFKKESSQKEQKTTEQTSEEKERKSPEQGPIFEIKKRLGKYDVSVGIERGQGLIKSNLDLNKKEFNLKITPDGIRKGMEFLEKPETQQIINEKLDQWQNWLKRKKAELTIKKYAKQEGKNEADVIKQFLDEIAREEKEGKSP